MSKLFFALSLLVFAGNVQADVATLQDLKSFKCSAQDSSNYLLASSRITAVDAKSALMLAIRDFKIGKNKSGDFYIVQPAKCAFAHDGCMPKELVVASLACND
jgi:hypothetical protein